MDSEEKAEPIDPNEKAEPIENAELTEPMLQNEFTDPMLRNEFREPMLFAFWSERAGASGAFSEDLEVVLDIINPAYRAARPYRTNHGARCERSHARASRCAPNRSHYPHTGALSCTREQVVLCRKGRIFLPAQTKNHLLAALKRKNTNKKLSGASPVPGIVPVRNPPRRASTYSLNRETLHHAAHRVSSRCRS